MLEKAVEVAASAVVGSDCSGTSVDTAVILEHENLLVQAGEVLRRGKKATKADVRHALVGVGRADLSKRLEARSRGRRVAVHPDHGLSGQIQVAIGQLPSKASLTQALRIPLRRVVGARIPRSGGKTSPSQELTLVVLTQGIAWVAMIPS